MHVQVVSLPPKTRNCKVILVTLLTENQCDALFTRAGQARSNRAEFECVLFGVCVRRLGHLPVTEDRGVRFSYTPPFRCKQQITVGYNALAGSSPAISASSRDVAEWQTRRKMHLVLWAGSEIWYHISFAPRSSGFESPRVHQFIYEINCNEKYTS